MTPYGVRRLRWQGTRWIMNMKESNQSTRKQLLIVLDGLAVTLRGFTIVINPNVHKECFLNSMLKDCYYLRWESFFAVL